MAKFQNKLLLSDYDNTLHYTEATLREGVPLPPINPRNLEAIRYWIEEGGRFSVATGRTLAAFRNQAAGIPMNAPAVVDNGGAIYDFASEKYLVKNILAASALDCIASVMEAFSQVSLELYRENGLVQVMRPTDWNRQHAMLTGLPFQVVERLEEPDLPMIKALFVAERTVLDQVKAFLERTGQAADCELIFSTDHLLELTAKGADKGKMALRLKTLCGCDALYCVGDHANDLPLLGAADRAFAPANAIAKVLSSGAAAVCHCLDGALGDVVDILDRELG